MLKKGFFMQEKVKKEQDKQISTVMKIAAVVICLVILIVAGITIHKSQKEDAASVSENMPASGNGVEEDLRGEVDISPGYTAAVIGNYVAENGEMFNFRPDGVFSGYISRGNTHAVGIYVVNTASTEDNSQDIITVTDGKESASYEFSFSENGELLLGNGRGDVIFTLKERKLPTAEDATVSENSKSSADLQKTPMEENI